MSKRSHSYEGKQILEITLNLGEAQAWALAEYIKRTSRLGDSHYRQFAIDEDEAKTMAAAVEKLRKALADAGVAPR